MSILIRQSHADNSTPLWESASSSGNSILPAGMVMAWGGILANPIPAGWLYCDGSPYPTANYPDLFAAIGYTYGGSGATFQVPDLAGAGIRGADAGIPAYVLGSTGGADSVTLSANNLPAHTHPITDPGHSHSSVVQGNGYTATDGGNGNRASAGTTGTATTGITGTGNNTTTGTAVSIVNPYTALYYIIKYTNTNI